MKIRPRTTYSFGRVLTLATDARVLSWPVIITCAVLSVLIHLAPNGSTVHGSSIVRIVVAVLAYIPGLGVVAVVSILSRSLVNEHWRVTLVLLSYFVGGALRGLIFALTFYAVGMSSALNLDFRIPGSAIPFGLAIAAATYAVAALEESRARIGSLRLLQQELQEAVTNSGEREDRVRNRTIAKIEQNVQEQLAALSTISDTVTAEELRSLASEVVRPLSHTLAERVPIWEATPRNPEVLRWRDIFAQLRPELSLKPLLLTLLATATGLTAFVYFYGFATAIPLVVCSVALLYGSIWVLRLVTSRLNAIRNIFLRGVVMTLLLMVVSVPSGFVDDLIVRGADEPWFVLRAGLIIVPIFGWFIALGGAAQAESARIESAYNDGIAQLSWLKARLNAVSWFEQGAFARTLHGPVQGAINKGIIRLGMAPTVSTGQIISEMRREIQQALTPELRWEGERWTLDELFSDLALTWAGLCQIDFAISPVTRDALASDIASASLCWDIIHESCGNAIRHGKARWISVRISDPSEGAITIDVIDNGTQYEFDSTPGMGSNMLDACTLSWSRTRDEGQTSLRAKLPVQLDERDARVNDNEGHFASSKENGK